MVAIGKGEVADCNRLVALPTYDLTGDGGGDAIVRGWPRGGLEFRFFHSVFLQLIIGKTKHRAGLLQPTRCNLER